MRAAAAAAAERIAAAAKGHVGYYEGVMKGGKIRPRGPPQLNPVSKGQKKKGGHKSFKALNVGMGSIQGGALMGQVLPLHSVQLDPKF